MEKDRIDSLVAPAPAGHLIDNRWIWGTLELAYDDVSFRYRRTRVTYHRNELKQVLIGKTGNQFSIILQDGREMCFRTNNAKNWVSRIDTLIQRLNPDAVHLEMRPCPLCNYLNPVSNFSCKYCGKHFETTQETKPEGKDERTPIPENIPNRFCVYCGSEIGSTRPSRCPRCARNLG
jgi:hypothetical protein